VVDFSSPGARLNSVPGRLVGVDLPTRAAAAPGSTARVWLDPAGTWLVAKSGSRHLNVRLEGNEIEFE
jgi:hypothetical protein